MNALEPTEFDTPKLARFTAAQVMEMVEAGLFDGRRFELVEGVVYQMNAQLGPHVKAIVALNEFLVETRAKSLRIGCQITLFLGEQLILEPDFAVFSGSFDSENARGSDLTLLVEVSDSTLRYDLGKKAALYAACGVADYWVVDLENAALHRHSEPLPNGYGNVVRTPFSTPVPLPYAPETTLNLAELLASQGAPPC